MGKFKEYTRRKLYDLVWATPIVKLAKEFGLSDVGFRKTCLPRNLDELLRFPTSQPTFRGYSVMSPQTDSYWHLFFYRKTTVNHG